MDYKEAWRMFGELLKEKYTDAYKDRLHDELNPVCSAVECCLGILHCNFKIIEKEITEE